MKGTVSISVASAMTGIQVPTLKFWEQEFSEHLKPSRTVGGQRRYSPEDIHVVFTIKRLLRDELMSLKGAARQLEQMFGEAHNA